MKVFGEPIDGAIALYFKPKAIALLFLPLFIGRGLDFGLFFSYYFIMGKCASL
ncbi:hypothetical protein [Coleofasciculus chthonoplastes]|uniref:hypothetical protein n=1 Tax=Coleofasciculus chthonoplastes TaxID=64178 RepID=UPI0032FD89A3